MKKIREKRQNSQMVFTLFRWRKVLVIDMMTRMKNMMRKIRNNAWIKLPLLRWKKV